MLAVPAYNPAKKFHPQANNWLGYAVTMDGATYYVTGDTDVTPEAQQVNCDILLAPIGGTYTMNAEEAAEFAAAIKPAIFVPTHYGNIIGTPDDGKLLAKKLSAIAPEIEVIEKIETFKLS